MAKKKNAAKKRSNAYTKQKELKDWKHHIGHRIEAKGSLKGTVLETGRDLLVGVIGGGLAGAAIGKWSLASGALLTGVGHYAGNSLATIFGVGMMASNGFQGSKSVSGLDGLNGVKERVKAYKDSFSEKLFVDKLIPGKAAATNGIGDVQYFNYANEMNGDLAALDYIESQITESGMQQMEGNPEFARQAGMTDYDAQAEGIDTDDIIM